MRRWFFTDPRQTLGSYHQTSMRKVIVTADPLCYSEGTHTRMLREAGFEIVGPARMPIVDEDATIEAIQGVVAVIAGSEPYTERVLAQLPELRIISRSGVGYDQIDVEAAERHGVVVTITPRGNFEAVAEHALALLLALTRAVVRNDRDMRRGAWPKTPLQPLRRKTLGIVGLGRIGQCVARYASALGVRVIGTDPFLKDEIASTLTIERTDFDDLLARSDYITLHVPLLPSTQGMIHRGALARLKEGAFLINTSRGGLVVEADLVDALRSGRLAGAGLDVFVDEPPRPDNPLLGLDNVVLSPHVAATDVQAMEDMATGAAQNVIDFFEGKLARSGMITRT